ncbi:tRNA (N6-threonylcarbamoyladenosine(37)-N6)-methyltransferase TrmO [Blautia sp. HCP3S3_G3]|uniref:tRNA (N6-threonylcarbamoyladenosine(37)-N6)-methyltransferase TrmO n=1 Tax=Blautia sp. HCP3S3_G3 TaxID=3438913 RepID=UPI003F8A83BA
MNKHIEQNGPQGQTMKVIARIHTDFPTKFGIPHQSSRIAELKSQIVFEPEYRIPEAVRGLEEFTHLWLIWEFSQSVREKWSPTVRPPKLGGNIRKGVFATRSPFRPNPLGLSSVRLERIEMDKERGPVLHITGADLMDGTPIYDIKPYLPYVDSHPDASGGFTDQISYEKLEVIFPDEWLEQIPESSREALIQVLAADPRPGYQKDADRIYGLAFQDKDIHFRVKGRVLTVCGISDYRKEREKRV